jgi:Putative transposase
LLTIAADPKHLGARIGATLVLHTWGSALTHHSHVHGIVPGGGLAPHGKRWVACRPGFFLSVRVLSRLFRRRFTEELQRVHQAGKLQFFGEHVALADATAFKAWLAPLRQCEWVVYAKRPFAGPAAVLAYLSRYTHRVAISNRRLIALDEHGVSFRWKDYRAKGKTRYKAMTLDPGEFMRRFLLHVLPGGLHRIRHYGLLANGSRKASLALAREPRLEQPRCHSPRFPPSRLVGHLPSGRASSMLGAARRAGVPQPLTGAVRSGGRLIGVLVMNSKSHGRELAAESERAVDASQPRSTESSCAPDRHDMQGRRVEQPRAAFRPPSSFVCARTSGRRPRPADPESTGAYSRRRRRCPR